jgi:hypothetical protein
MHFLFLFRLEPGQILQQHRLDCILFRYANKQLKGGADYEAHVSAKKTPKKQRAWFSQEDEDV